MCENCKNFYTCDNMGWYEECKSNGYSNYEKGEKRMNDYSDCVSEDGTYLIPVSWEVYSTIRIKANNLQDALEKAEAHIEEIPCGTNTEYIDGSYKLDKDGDLIMAQEFFDMSDKVLKFD